VLLATTLEVPVTRLLLAQHVSLRTAIVWLLLLETLLPLVFATKTTLTALMPTQIVLNILQELLPHV